MTDKFGREYDLDLSVLLNTKNVVFLETEEQYEAVVMAAIEQYPERVGDAWRINHLLHFKEGTNRCLSFRGIRGNLVHGSYWQYNEMPNTKVNILSFEDILKTDTEIPESDFGFEYILG